MILDIASRLELFVDNFLIESIDGLKHQLHNPIPREIVLTLDAPWEGNVCGYYTVFKDESVYRMYYRGSDYLPENNSSTHKTVTCYAESNDGIHWYRPNLYIAEFDGTRKNNIVYDGAGADNFVPFKDTNPNCPIEEKYKAIATVNASDGLRCLIGFYSPDGFYWWKIKDEPIIKDEYNGFDSQNLVFWDSNIGKYRAYWRVYRKRGTNQAVNPNNVDNHNTIVRDIKTATSDDFIHWSKPVWLKYPNAPEEELYTNQVTPYLRAPHIYLGFPTRYIYRGWSDSMKRLPGLGHRKLRAELSEERSGTALTDGLFMTSRDGITFNRWKEAFIRPGLRTANNWAYGDNYQCWGIIITRAVIEESPDELSFFVSEKYRIPGGSRLRRFSMRTDGFVSINASGSGGEMITKPFIFNGNRLILNFSTSAAGNIRVGILDEQCHPIEGYTLEDCSDIFGDDIERIVTWNKNGADIKKIAGKPVRLKFVMKDADLYSMRFNTM